MQFLRSRSLFATALWPALMAGCISSPVPDFPEEEVVFLNAAGDSGTAPRDAGPPGLANATWAVYLAEQPTSQPADQGAPIGPYGGLAGLVLAVPREPGDLLVRAEFGDKGEITQLTDNTFYTPDILPTLIDDGAAHETTLTGVSYAQESYGLQVGDQYAFVAPVIVYVFNIELARGAAYSWGRIDGERIDGTLGFFVNIAFPPTSAADEFKIFALREQP